MLLTALGLRGNNMSNLKELASEGKGKVIVYVMLDIIFINFSLIIAMCLWYGGTIPGLPGGAGIAITSDMWQWFGITSLVATLSSVIVYWLFRFYSSLWKYATIDDVYKIIVADTIIFVIIYFSHILYSNKIELPKRLLMVAWTIDVVLFVFSRSGYRLIKRMFISLGHIITKKAGSKRVMVVGAGYAGYNVVRSILNHEKGYEDRVPIIIVDDDIKKNNTNIKGIRVTFDTANIMRLAKEYEIEEIVIAIPSASNIQLKRIMDYCTQTDCVLKMIPPMSDISNGDFHILRDVNISDLLLRDEVDIDVAGISGYLKGKTVLVTGGGGSIGAELCRQIIRFEPKRLIIFDIYENNAYELYNELKGKYPNTDIKVSIGSIRDMNCMDRLFDRYRPQVVYHAAAHKHVPLMEEVPAEAVKNNVFGTLNVVICADKYKVERFVLLSTDKAVNPTSIMGATKRITEMIIQNMADKSSTKYMAVRFGNVLGSNGSVIPLFQKQIKEGGPVTVTDPEITRFFMTIPEASRLVLQAAGIGESGRIYVLDMGEQIKIDDLARNLIKLSGYIPDKDIKIVYTGLRPGEKLYEELVMAEEKEELQTVYHNKIFVVKPTDEAENNIDEQLDKLYNATLNRPDKVVNIIKEIVPNYRRS